MSSLSEHLRTALGAALRHREPATDEDVRSAVSDALSVGGHNYTPMIRERLTRAGGRVPAIVRRLLDAEAEAERYRVAWRMAYQRAQGRGWAADRAGARARELQTALQDGVGALLAMQMERNAAQRAAAEARAAGLLEAAEIVGNDDTCECGGCDTCIPRALAAKVRDRAYAVAAAPDGGSPVAYVMACAQCEGLLGWVDCPTGGWWAHREHPADGHEAEPIPAAALNEDDR